MGPILHTIDVSTPAVRESLLLVDLDFSDKNLKEAILSVKQVNVYKTDCK